MRQLYEQNMRNIVASNCNNNIGQLYTIDDPCKIAKRRYKLHEIIGKASIPVMLITISYQEKLQQSCLISQNSPKTLIIFKRI